MARQSTKTSHAELQEPVAGDSPERTRPEPSAAAGEAPNNDRDQHGRFSSGNRIGTGNPHARHCARMLAMFRNAITDEEMLQLCRVLFEKASKGDASALKMIWQYKVGKPLPAPNPDLIDRDEWNRYQTDAMTLDEMKQVLGRLPSSVGNTIVAASLPDIVKAFNQDLGQQLVRSLHGGSEEKRGGSREKLERKEGKEENREERTAVKEAVSNGEFGRAEGEARASSPATGHTPPAGNPDHPASRLSAVSNGKSKKPAKSKAERKLVTRQWLEPITRKVNGRKRAALQKSAR
jgi:hypothetical protein